MARLFVRQTYLHRTLLTGNGKTPTPPVLGTHTGVGGASQAMPSSGWQQLKPATYGGQGAWLCLEAQLHQPFVATATDPRIIRQRVYHFHLKGTPRRRVYRVYGYVPFSGQEEEAYRRAPSAALGQQMLGQALQSDLATLASGLGQSPQLALAIQSLQLQRQKSRCWQVRSRLAFDLRFSVPLVLPEYVGIGRGVEQGSGVVRL